MTTISLTINGTAHGPVEVRDELTMNDFLREYLGLTGTKFGCGAAQCLSCAVIVDEADGTSYTSPTCVVPAVSFTGKRIRTIEGHAANGELSALQKAFVEHFAFQCGYCTPGQICSAVGMLREFGRGMPSAVTPIASTSATNLNEEELKERMSGNLCRCGAYVGICDAIRTTHERIGRQPDETV